MKRLYVLLPLLATSLFAAYYHHWEQKQSERAAIHSCPAVPFDPYEPYAGRNGREDALADLARNNPQLLTYGLPVHWIREYGVVLERDYGVRQSAVAGCVVTESLVKYTADYNAVIEAHLRRVHGADVMDKVVRKAEALYASRHPTPATPEDR